MLITPVRNDNPGIVPPWLRGDLLPLPGPVIPEDDEFLVPLPGPVVDEFTILPIDM